MNRTQGNQIREMVSRGVENEHTRAEIAASVIYSSASPTRDAVATAYLNGLLDGLDIANTAKAVALSTP